MYHLLFYANIRRPIARCRRQQEDKHRLRYQPVNGNISDFTKISYPLKAYQVYNINADRIKSLTGSKILIIY